MDAIRVLDLTKRYGKARGVSHVNMTVHEGDFFGFIGPNGAGKSTTIRSMLGMIRPTDGTCQVLGRDIRKEKTQILKETGYLPSETQFYSGMKVREILKLSADLRGKDCRERAAELCERMQLDLNRKAEELSFGNRKKAAIAAALQHDPKLIILDEPTSGLDPLMQREFFKILQERHEQGTTIFLSSHILSEIQKYCNRAAIIREGQLLACDEVSNLVRSSIRKVTLRGKADLRGTDGVHRCRETEDGYTFLFDGNMQQLLSCLAAGQVKDLAIQEPELEEVFMHYYEGGNKGGEEAGA